MYMRIRGLQRIQINYAKRVQQNEIDKLSILLTMFHFLILFFANHCSFTKKYTYISCMK